MRINSEEIEGEEFPLITEKFQVGGVYSTTKEVDAVGDINNISIRQAEDDSFLLIKRWSVHLRENRYYVRFVLVELRVQRHSRQE